MKQKLAPFIEYAAESTTACLVTMVQGNLLALTLGHLLVASQTGVIAGFIAAIALFMSRSSGRWIVSSVLGVATAIVDFIVHPGMFGPVFLEAAVTGFTAAILSYVVGTLVRIFRKKPALTD